MLFAGLQGQLLAAEPGSIDQSTGKDGALFQTEEKSIWNTSVGNGFRSGTQTFDVGAAGGRGVAAFGSVQQHDLAWASISYGRILGGVQGENHWYEGNFELLGELFGGSQYAPSAEWIAGFTPHLRYYFVTGTRLMPFFDAGAGVTGTGIGKPDLSTKFEFNTQGGIGTSWFFKDDVALTMSARYVHISNAGISQPNHGVNTIIGTLGMTWFF